MMDSANKDNIRDLERDEFTTDTKQTPFTPQRKTAPKMLFIRHYMFAIITVFLVAVTLVSGLSPVRVPRSPTLADQKKLQEIVDSSGAELFSLHDSLRKHLSSYKVDAYNEAKIAVAGDQEQNGESESSLVNLLKRQEASTTNGTVITPPGVTTETTATTATSTTTETASVTSSTVTTEVQPPIRPTTSPSTTQPTTSPTTTSTNPPSEPPSTSPPTPPSGPSTSDTPTSSSEVPPSPTTDDSPMSKTDGNPTKGTYTETHLMTIRSDFRVKSLLSPYPALAPYLNSTCMDSTTSNNSSPIRGAYVKGSESLRSRMLVSICMNASPRTTLPVDASSGSSNLYISPITVSRDAASAVSKTTNSQLPSIYMSRLASLASGASKFNVSSTMLGPTFSNFGASDSRSVITNSTCGALRSSNSMNPKAVAMSVPTVVANAFIPYCIPGPAAPVETQKPRIQSSLVYVDNMSLSSSSNLLATVGGSSFSKFSGGSPFISNFTNTISSQIESNSFTDPSVTTPPTTLKSEPEQSVTSLDILTTTSANGDVATITRTTVVQAGQADKTAAGDASKTKSGALGLQTNEATRKTRGMSIVTAFILTIGGYLTTSLSFHFPCVIKSTDLYRCTMINIP